MHDADDSDDENREFPGSKYNECGTDIKQLLKANAVNDNTKQPKPAARTWTSKPLEQSTSTNVEFQLGIRIVNPLVAADVLQQRLVGRDIVPMASLKMFVRKIPSEKDWIVAGVLVQKSPTKTSQKGKHYMIWTISDLKTELKSVSIFLFGAAYKELWKTTAGTALGILNPTVMDGQGQSKDEVTLSINNHQLVMTLGQSKDFGTCKSLKKNGERCNNFINTAACNFCVYHLRQEYQKCSTRSELQSSFSGRGLNALRNKVLGKDQVFYGGKLYTAIPNNTTKKQVTKDNGRLKALDGLTTISPISPKLQKQKLAAQHDASPGQRRKDLERLKLLGFIGSGVTQSPEIQKPEEVVVNKEKPVLLGLEKGEIDLNEPFVRRERVSAKSNAVKWVQNNGPIAKKNPNNTRGSNEGRKRALESLNITPAKKQKTEESGFTSERFKKLMAASSTHSDLLEQRDDQAKEKYFQKLEMKEKLEEKMLTTYKMPCKAVRCLICKYTSFSASDHCKAEKHTLKVFDSMKRFYKCGNCKNRTACLTFIPTQPCSNCGSSNWEKTTMMKEKIDEFKPKLSIRGGEQSFIHSNITDHNLDLLVPDTNA